MPDQTIKCPKCGTENELNEALINQIGQSIKVKYEAEIRQKESENQIQIKKIETEYKKKLSKESESIARKALLQAYRNVIKKSSRFKRFIISAILGLLICAFTIYKIYSIMTVKTNTNGRPLQFYASCSDGTAPSIEISPCVSSNEIWVHISDYEQWKPKKLAILTTEDVGRVIPKEYNYRKEKIILPEAMMGTWDWEPLYLFLIDYSKGEKINSISLSFSFKNGINAYSYDSQNLVIDLRNASHFFGVKEKADKTFCFTDEYNIVVSPEKYFRMTYASQSPNSSYTMPEAYDIFDLPDMDKLQPYYKYNFSGSYENKYLLIDFRSDKRSQEKTYYALFLGPLVGVGLSLLVNSITSNLK